MIRLVVPCEEYLASYVEAREECLSRNISDYVFTDPSACDLFGKFDDYRRERNLKPGRVGSHYFWLVDDQSGRFIGEISVRHRLTDALLRYGGHIGYGVRPSEWNKGYGTLMLRLALEQAMALGLDRVLITCDDDNIASARVMEKNGFLLEDRIGNTIDGQSILTRRYWKTL